MEAIIKHYTVRSRAYTNLLTRVLRSALRAVRVRSDVRSDGAVSVIFVGDAKMRRMNKQYRGKDKTTNVLAFPAQKSHKSEDRDLGDIFISYPEAVREAKKYGWTLRYEIIRLATHGFLHLCGYDHREAVERSKMERIERKIAREYAQH